MSQFLIGPAPTISGADLAGRTLHDCGAARSPAYRSRLTLRWRGLNSNFQYAGGVNLVVAPFRPPNAWDGWLANATAHLPAWPPAGSPSQFSDSTTLCIRSAWTRPPRREIRAGDDILAAGRPAATRTSGSGIQVRT
jgi:hypothetical protein